MSPNDPVAEANNETRALAGLGLPRALDEVRSTPYGYLVTDVCGVITEANQVAAALMQTRKELLIGKPIALLLEGESRRTLYRWLLALHHRATELARNEPLTITRPRLPPVQVMVSVVSICDQAGTPMSLRWTLLDTAGHYRAAMDLRRAEHLSEALFDAAQAIILVVDGEGRIVRSNAFFLSLSGHADWELIGHRWQALLQEADRSAADEFLDAARRLDATCRLTCPLVTRDGASRLIAWSARAMEAAIETASVVVIGHDITDAHLAQQQAIETARLAAIGQMTATIAHEGRNALQRMAAGLERLTWRVSDKPELLEIIGRVRAAKKDLTRLFDDVRTYAAPVQLELADCDLRDLWQTAWKHSTDAIPQKRATLQEQADGIDMHCLADPFRIDQLFRNIFDNALTACPEPARVEIACVATNDTGNHTGAPGLRIAIRDNGPGFTAEQRRRIFEPFYTTKTHGSGLGMTIAKRIVESHGGAIALGDAPSGAEFLITLPRSPS